MNYRKTQSTDLLLGPRVKTTVNSDE